MESIWNFLAETIYALDKKSSSKYSFSDLSSLMKVPPIPHFWNHKVRVYSYLASLFSVIEDNSSLFL